MNRHSYYLYAGLSVIALALAGCQTPPTQVDRDDNRLAQPTSAETRPNAETPINPAPEETESENPAVIFKSQQIEVSKRVVDAASVGGVLKYEISIKALDDINNVRVNEVFPNGVRFISADPSSNNTGNNVSWTFPSMSKDQIQKIDVTCEPTAEGDHQICSTVTIDHVFCLDFFAGQPKLEAVKKGQPSVELGDEASWTVAVTNSGSAAATNVVVIDTLPDAFTATSSLRQSIGDLAAGETKSVSYTAKAVKQGKFTNQAVASYDGGEKGGSGASPIASSPIAVVQSGIRVRKTGPSEAYVFKPVAFDITVENTGDTDLTNVRITDILPSGSSVADNGRGRVSGNAIGWMIPKLPAGSSQLIRTEIAATRKGESTNAVRIISESGLEASDSVTTNWLAVPGVTIDITDSKDPVREREAVTYAIQVKNQGDFEPVSGTVTVTFSDSIKPTAVGGDAQGTINGQTVTFPRTTLEPGKDTNLSITAEGASIGPGRAVMNFSADFLNDPIISQEATNVY
jgi:uncharacterized repeat protein (TIGR01451 family)